MKNGFQETKITICEKGKEEKKKRKRFISIYACIDYQMSGVSCISVDGPTHRQQQSQQTIPTRSDLVTNGNRCRQNKQLTLY